MNERDDIYNDNIKSIIHCEGSSDLMTLEEVAAFLGFSNSKIYQMVRANEIPAFKVSRSWRFSKSEVLIWLDEHSSELRAEGEADAEWKKSVDRLTGLSREAYDAEEKEAARGKDESDRKEAREKKYESEIKEHNERKNELTVLELMKRTGLFRGMSDLELHNFLMSNWPEKRLFRKGDAVMFETEKLDRLYIVEKGCLAALLDISDVDSPAKKYFRHGSMIGLDVMMSDVKTSYMDIWAEEDTFVVTFSVEKMMTYMYSRQALFLMFATNAMKILSDENIRWMKHTRLLMEKSIREKIIYYLRLEERKSSTPKIKIRDDRQGMASHLGINRSVLSRELMLMRSEGLIDFKRNDFVILAPARILYGIPECFPAQSDGVGYGSDGEEGAKVSNEEVRGSNIPLELKQIDINFESFEEKEARLERQRSRFERHINKNESRKRGRPRSSRSKKDGVI